MPVVLGREPSIIVSGSCRSEKPLCPVARFQAAKQAHFPPSKNESGNSSETLFQLTPMLAHLLIDHGIGTTRAFSLIAVKTETRNER